MTIHPLFPEGCPLPINDHVNLFRKNHTPTQWLLKALKTSPPVERLNTMERDLKVVAQYAFEMALPYDKSIRFSALGIRIRTQKDIGYDRVAIVPTELLIPMARAGMPLRWKLGQNDYPQLHLRWEVTEYNETKKKDMQVSVPRLLFNGPTDRHCRPVWSPLLLHPNAWVIRKGKGYRRNRDDLPVCLKLHKLHHERTRGHSWSTLRDAEKVLVRPEAINFEHHCTPSKR